MDTVAQCTIQSKVRAQLEEVVQLLKIFDLVPWHAHLYAEVSRTFATSDDATIVGAKHHVIHASQARLKYCMHRCIKVGAIYQCKHGSNAEAGEGHEGCLGNSKDLDR